MEKIKDWKKSRAVSSLKTKYNLTYSGLAKLLRIRIKEEETIPISIFTERLAPLEVLVKYLKENLNLKFSEIASLLLRDRRTIWATYKNALKKKKEKIKPTETKIFIPLSIFSARLTIFEAIVIYLKDVVSISSSKIAELLNRDPRNISTVYSRAKIKLAKSKSKPEGSKK